VNAVRETTTHHRPASPDPEISMKSTWMLGAVLFLGACGGAETDGESAALLTPDGEMTEVTSLDLTEDGRTYVIDVRDDGRVAGDVTVNTRRGIFALSKWVDEVRRGHQLPVLSSDDGEFILLTDLGDIAEDNTPENLARKAREQARTGANCPEECLHCPEDNVFLCQSMCGAGR